MALEKLLKRLNHQISKVKDPTISQLLIDAETAIRNANVNVGVQEKLKEALNGQIAVFEGDEFPLFRQGEPNHELESLFTAEQATALVEALRAANARAEQSTDAMVDMGVPEKDKEAVEKMMEMTVLMERAGFIGIMESYKTARFKFPDCIEEERRTDGTIVAFNVELPDGTVVTLRNPECVEPEQAVPTSVNAPATSGDQTK